MDFGFAPNPFHGFCSLACCKSQTRGVANVGDLIVGTTSPASSAPRIIYIMRITSTVSFQTYWEGEEFQVKKVIPSGSEMLRHGDNIYHKCDFTGEWIQENSRHSDYNNQTNFKHRDSDTRKDRVLLSTDFVYFGRYAIEIPSRFRNFIVGSNLFGAQNFIDLVALTRAGKGMRSHNKINNSSFVLKFDQWFRSLGRGVKGLPSGWAD